MSTVRYDPISGRIDAVGTPEGVPSVEGLELLTDFIEPSDLRDCPGKYEIVDGSVVEREGWSPPSPALLPPDQQVSVEMLLGVVAERDATIVEMKEKHAQQLKDRDEVDDALMDWSMDLEFRLMNLEA